MQPRILSTLLALVALTTPIAAAQTSDEPTPWAAPADAVHASVLPVSYEFKDEQIEGILVAIGSSILESNSFAAIFVRHSGVECEVITNEGTAHADTILVFIASDCIPLDLDAVGAWTTQPQATWWTSTSAVVYYGPCALLMPGVDPDGKPPVFLIIRWECLEPYVSGPPDTEAEWRWW